MVKALNTLAAALIINPRQLADGDHTVFVCANHADAKKTVTSLLESFGHTDVIDLGDHCPPGHRDVPSDLATADGLARQPELQRQGRSPRPWVRRG